MQHIQVFQQRIGQLPKNFNKRIVQRNPELNPPIQTCDAKNGNTNPEANAVVCNCNTHSRRYFVDVADNHPDECAYVLLDVYQEIYKNDAIAKQQQMSPNERLAFHQKKSGPIMNEFHRWLNTQFEDRKVEPNSDLGTAISYVLNHWPELTRFLSVPGAPLDNNICEQAIKRSICHRKNSLFYKTEHGAYIGDMFMSMINTCRLNGVNPFDYLTELQRHSSDVFKNPSKWMPWNYRDRLRKLISEFPETINSESLENAA